MQNRSAYKMRLRKSLGAAVVIFSFMAARSALADDKKECSANYDQAQSLRLDGKLQAARQAAVSCTRETCAEFIRVDCAKWLGEIDQSQPSVVLDVIDMRGHEAHGVQVTLDGNPWLEKLDGGAKLVDPGQHRLHFVIRGHSPIDATVEIHEGEKNRKIQVSFPPEAQEGPTAPPVNGSLKGSDSMSSDLPSRSPSVAPWVIGGVGVASLVVGAITGAIVLHDKSGIDRECPNKNCKIDESSKVSQGSALGKVTTVVLVVGAIGVGTGAVWLIARPRHRGEPPNTSALSMGPAVSTTGGGWRLEGSW